MWIPVGSHFVHLPPYRMVRDVVRTFGNFPEVMLGMMNLRPWPILGEWRGTNQGYPGWHSQVGLRCMADALFSQYPGFTELDGGGMAFDYWNGERFSHVVLNGIIGHGDPISVFYNEEYRMAGIAGAYVVDAGAAAGDSPIYFSLMGAKKVWAYEYGNDEPNPSQRDSYGLMLRNIEANAVRNVVPINRKVTCFDDIADPEWMGQPRVLLKMDIEGAEYEVFDSATNAELRHFSEIILEYHYGPERIMAKLHEAGFKAHASVPVRAKGMVGGLIRAVRK